MPVLSQPQQEREAKLQRLAEIEGYADAEALVEAAAFDGVSPGICVGTECEYTCEVEPDQGAGYCEECRTPTVQSALVLAGLI